ncbi:MAG: hypothetical protein ACI841_005059 [Planctomycetota bacterium]|jgi:hypothetical protein
MRRTIQSSLLFLALAPVSIAQTILYTGLEFQNLGAATAALSGDRLVVSNIGSSGDDGVRVELGEMEGFMSVSPVGPGAQLGASMQSEAFGTVGGLAGAPAGSVGLTRTSNGFLIDADFWALGSPAYSLRIFQDQQLIYCACGLTSNVIEMHPSTTLEMECFYFAKDNIWIWLGDPIITFSDTSTGSVYSGNRIEISPDTPVGPTTGDLAIEMTASNMPNGELILLTDAAIKYGNLHRAGHDDLMSTTTTTACSDCLVISNIGSSGDDGVEVFIDYGPDALTLGLGPIEFHSSSGGSGAGKVSFSPAAGSPVTAEIEFVEVAGTGDWEFSGEFFTNPTGPSGYDVQLLLNGSPVASANSGNPVPLYTPTTFDSGSSGQFWMGGLRPGFSFQWDTEISMSLGGTTVLADEARILSPQPAAASADRSRTLILITDGIPGVTIKGEDTALGETYCSATANSTGAPAEIFVYGSTSIAQNDLVLNAAPVPNQFGIFYYGPNQIQAPFGDGVRCVGGSICRLDVEMASDNLLSHAVDYTTIPSACAIQAGETHNIQAWFRDPTGGQAGFNLSNAIELMFQP